MAEYIEREALIEKISKLGVAGAFTQTFKNVTLKTISEEPAADVQEVRHEYPISSLNDVLSERIITVCNGCGGRISKKDNWCKHCGAKMDKEDGKK